MHNVGCRGMIAVAVLLLMAFGAPMHRVAAAETTME